MNPIDVDSYIHIQDNIQYTYPEIYYTIIPMIEKSIENIYFPISELEINDISDIIYYSLIDESTKSDKIAKTNPLLYDLIKILLIQKMTNMSKNTSFESNYNNYVSRPPFVKQLFPEEN